MKAEVGADSIMYTADYPPARKALLINRVALASRHLYVYREQTFFFQFSPIDWIYINGYKTASRLPLSPFSPATKAQRLGQISINA